MTFPPIPAFGETEYFDTPETGFSRVVLFPQTDAARYAAYCALLTQEGFVQKESVTASHRCYAAYEKDGSGVFLNYFANTKELQIVTEENSPYFTYSDTCGDAICTPQITHVRLNAYGLSLVIRLSDGRFIVIDGGDVYESDTDALYARLKKDSPHETPVIAAWIMTHAHCDHFYCFFPFMQKYANQVTVEKFLYHFPEADDLEHYPKLATPTVRFAKWLGREITGGGVVQLFFDGVAEMGVPVYTPRTGQTYTVGDAKLFFAACRDDSVHLTGNLNASSLMFIIELAGQRIFIGGDGSFGDTRLPSRYGAELKCDILQVPHHGFGAGLAEDQIAGYRHIAAPVCILPTGMDIAYTSFTAHKEGTKFLMTRMNVQEMITGETERTLPLPYTADPAGSSLLQQRYLEGQDNCGARTWIFTDLNTGNKEDFIFTLLNTTYVNADIAVELYFEDMQKKIIERKTTGLRLGMFKLNCLLSPDEDQSQFDAPDFLEKMDIPAGTNFAVRFISSLPVVISHPNHKAAYHSSVV